VPPGGGRVGISERFTRHFHIVNIPETDSEIMQQIFHTILGRFTKSWPFIDDIDKMTEDITGVTLRIYNNMLSKVLPTPNKPQYTFNLRDVSKVFQSMLKIRPDKFKSTQKLKDMLIHELERVFKDRLVDKDDKKKFYEFLLTEMKGSFKAEYGLDELMDYNYIFGDFMGANREYDIIEDPRKLVKQIAVYMSDTSINIELFRDAVNHLTRCCRAIR
jgi:dynein heavy chain